jgi:hypothetical protein
MVSGRPGTNRRGQIMLVGALALAVLLLALVPVYNAVFMAEGAGAGEPEGVSDTALSAEATGLRAAQGLAVRTGHGSVYADTGEVREAFEPVFENYTLLHDEAAVAGSDTYVETTFDADAPGTEYGVRAVQNRSGYLDKPTVAHTPGPKNWFVVGNSDRTRLGWFTARLDVSNLSETDRFTVAASNGTHSVELGVGSDGGSTDVTVNASGDVGGMDEAVTCSSRAGEIVVDLYRGSADRGDCTFTGLDAVEGPVSVRIRNGSSAYGVYELVVRNGTGLQPTVETCTAASPPSTSSPCSSPTFWQLAVTTRVETDRTAYENRVNVSVYGAGGD